MLFVLLPAVGYILTASALERSRVRAQAQTDLLNLVRLAANEQRQSIDEMARTLALVATLDPVQAGWQSGAPSTSPDSFCRDRLSQLARQYPDYTGFVVWNLHGAVACPSSLPVEPVSAADEAWFRQAVASDAFTMGDFQFDASRKESVLTFAYPLTSTNGPILLGIVSSGLSLGHLIQDDVLPLPPDAVVTVFDHNGLVLARSVDAATWVGKSLPNAAGLVSDLSSGTNVTERTDIDGTARLSAFAPVTGPGGNLVYLSIGRPTLAVYGPADTGLVVGLAITGGLTALALLLAGWWSRQTLLRPMQALLSTTDRLAHGDLTARALPDQAGSEVDRLAAAFNAMAANLQQSEGERHKAREGAEVATQLAQHGQARAAQLEAVSAGLSIAQTPVDVLDVILRQGAGAVGALAATLLLLSEDGAWLRQAATVGYSDRISRLFQQFPVASPLPASDAVRTGEAVWIESAAAYRARYPQMTDIINLTDYEAAVAVPLRYAGRVTGVLTLSFPGVRVFTSEIQIYLVTLASFCAQALERARLYDETRRLNNALEAGVRAGAKLEKVD